MARQAVQGAGDPLLPDIGVARSRDQAEPPVARLHQSPDQQALAARRVTADARHRSLVSVAVVEDHGHPMAREVGELFARQPCGRDHPVHAITPDLFQHRVDVALRLQGEQEHARAPVRQAPGDLG